MLILELGLVGNSEPGSCKRLNLLFVSCQNLAEIKMPRDPVPNSCNPEVLPEETLSLSDTVKSPVREYSITELASGFCLALPKSKLNLLSSTITDGCNDLTIINSDPRLLLSPPLQSKLLDNIGFLSADQGETLDLSQESLSSSLEWPFYPHLAKSQP
uniref:Uncharacterized protein n=1 Tax=Manihot esculenta TaxID=3983 RepID=A0A2C9WHH7_MANES